LSHLSAASYERRSCAALCRRFPQG